MNKKFILLPAAVLLLAACGGASSSTPSSSSASSAALDSNTYSVVGAFQGWDPLDEDVVMSRQSGTNVFSYTLDLYIDTQWKLVINQSWDAGQVSPSSPGVIIQENGVAIADFATAGGTNIEAVDDGFDGLNFNTKVDGNYTISFTSLPALSRIFNVTRNGDPIVPAPQNIDWYLVGGFTDPMWENGFVEANKLTQNGTTYTKTLDLLIGDQFKLVRMVGTIPTWNGASIKGTVLPADSADAISGSDNFEVTVNGNYSVTIDDSVSPLKANFVRLGAPVVRVPAPETDPANWFIVGSLTNPEWTPSDKSLALTPVTDVAGSYSIDLDLLVDQQFKVKTGDTWPTGRDLGFSAVTSNTAGLFANEGGNIKSLVSGKFRLTFTYAPSAGSITIEPLGWIGYSTVVTQGATSTSIAYVNPDPADWGRNTQLRLTAPFDQAKEGVEFDFTGKAGDQYLFKLEGGGAVSELMATATGDAQKFIVPVVSLTPAQRSGLNLFVIFARTNASTGTLVVRDWKYVDSVAPAAPEWLAINTTVTVVNNVMTMAYTNTPNEFWNQHAAIAVIGFDGSKDSVTVPFNGEAGQEYMFKFEYPGHTNNVEFRVVATGAPQTTIMNLASLTAEIRSSINKFVVFSTTTGASGSVFVSPYVYTPTWVGEGDGATVAVNAGAMTFTYTSRPEFYSQNAQLPIIGFDGSKTSVSVTFTGVEDQEYIFKFEYPGHTHNAEYRFTATGVSQTVTIDITKDKNNAEITPAQRATFNKFVVFSAVNTSAGSITVTSLEYLEV
jgi:azurin